MIIFIHGAINSGKTLLIKKIYKNFFINRKDVLCIISNKRYNATTREYWLYLNSKLIGKGIIINGKNIIINHHIFEKVTDIDVSNYKYSIIDEIGPFELKKMCFYKLFLAIIRHDIISIVVVRTYMIKDVISFFKIKEYKIYNITEEKDIFLDICKYVI
ncbi:MAG: hypothetical protein N2Z20_05800 [Elusimicrobiales bacterium]|nr:hypothetical protein [Elusimicrobiales bacterium]